MGRRAVKKLGGDDTPAREANKEASANHHVRYSSKMDDAVMILAVIAGLALYVLLHFLHPVIFVFP